MVLINGGCPVLAFRWLGWDFNRVESHLGENPLALTLPGSPHGLNLNQTLFAGGVVLEGTPRPLFRPLHEATLYRVSVYVPELLYSFFRSTNIEVVIAGLPEVSDGSQVARYGLLDGLHGTRQTFILRFTD